MNQKIIYFISSISIKPLKSFHKNYIQFKLPFYNNDINALHFSFHTHMWVPSYKEAERIIHADAEIFSECGHTDYMVIEGLPSLLYAFGKIKKQTFFKLMYDTENDVSHYEKMNGWPEDVLKYYEDRHLVKQITRVGN